MKDVAGSLGKQEGMKEMEHGNLTGRTIACGIEVHKTLGPGFLETITWVDNQESRKA